MRRALLTISAAMLPILGHAAPERQQYGGQPVLNFTASADARIAYDVLQPWYVDTTGSDITITYDDDPRIPSSLIHGRRRCTLPVMSRLCGKTVSRWMNP